MDEDALDAAREAVAATRVWREQMRHDWGIYREPEEVLDAAVGELLSERDRLRAAFDRIALDPAEYRHALGHVAACADNCNQCRRLAQQALDGGVDVQERATDILAERDRLRAVVDAVRVMWDNIVGTADEAVVGFPVTDYHVIERALDQLDESAEATDG